MGMHVGHHLHLGLATMLPERTVPRSIEHHNACVQAVQIEVIVADKAPYCPAIANTFPQQERAAFSVSPAASRKFVEEGTPHAGGTAQAMVRCHAFPYTRSN